MNVAKIIVRLMKSMPALAPALHDWLGNGGTPVASELAEKRSLVCVHGDNGKPCPMNGEPNWWERVKTEIALAIREELAVKHHLGLFVSRESDLHMCKACGCCLRLKVWTPIGHIDAHLTEAVLERVPAFCWMKAESEIKTRQNQS